MNGDSFLGLKVIVNSNLAAGTVMVSEDVWALMKKAAEKMPEECPRCGSTELGSEPDGGGVRCGPCGLPVFEWETYSDKPKTLLGFPVMEAPEGTLPKDTIVLARSRLIVDCPHCKQETRVATGMCTHCGKGIYVGTQRYI